MKIINPNSFILVDSTVPDTTYAQWDINTSYAAGAYVSLSSNHGEYQALTSNVGKTPQLNPTDWKFLGTTNRWKMFDQFLNTQTSKESEFTTTVSSYDAKVIFLGNITADTVQIQIKDNALGSIIEDKTFSLINEPTDWLMYFYNDVTYVKRNIIYERTTLNRDVSIIITAKSSTVARVGIFIVGSIYSIGTTQWNFKLSSLDYSTVATDTASGATYLQKGNYAKLLDGQLFIKTIGSDAVYSVLVSAQGTPVVFYDQPEITLLYGFIKTFDMTIVSPIETRVDIKLQGLI